MQIYRQQNHIVRNMDRVNRIHSSSLIGGFKLHLSGKTAFNGRQFSNMVPDLQAAVMPGSPKLL